MLPTPPPTPEPVADAPDRQPVKHDFYNLDNLISDLNQPKEQIQSARPSAPGKTFPGSPYNEMIDSPEVEPIPADVAALSGKAIAGTIDTVVSTGFSLYAKAANPEKYEANDKQIEKLNQAWAAVAQKYNYKVEDSPWFNVILLTVAVYLPIWNEAQKDRRFAEMDERMKEMDGKIRENEARIIAMTPTPVIE